MAGSPASSGHCVAEVPHTFKKYVLHPEEKDKEIKKKKSLCESVLERSVHVYYSRRNQRMFTLL